MPIRILAEGDKYRVWVTPPRYPSWESPGPMTATEVLAKLSELGCHSTDVTDALYAANPAWGLAHDEEVRRRRGQ